jgi:hypothetical protein
MQLKNSALVFALALVAGFGLTRCGGGLDGAGAVGDACTADTECGTDLVCHQNAKVCVETCGITADCDQETTQKNCTPTPWTAAATDGGTGAKICGCSTDALCGTDKVCSTADKICRSKCTGSADCNGRTCDTTTGQCSGSVSGGTCNSSATTLGANGGPDTCNYGELCATSNVCEAVPEGTCTSASGAPAWNKAAKDAPVIRSVTAEGAATSNPTTECGDSGPKSVFTIRYYSPTALLNSTTFATYKSQLKFKFTGGFVEPSFEAQMPTAGQKFGEVKVGVCGRSSGTGAIYIADPSGKTSNVVCVTY